MVGDRLENKLEDEMGRCRARRWAMVATIGALGAAGCDDKGGDSAAAGEVNLQIVSVICTYEDGDTAECQVVIENNGGDDAGGFRVGVFVMDEEPAPDDTPAAVAPFDGLAAGDIQGVTLVVYDANGTLWAVADLDDDVSELYEDDNAASTTAMRRRR